MTEKMEPGRESRRSVERATPPPDFPKGRLGAGELVSLVETAETQPPMFAALKPLELADQNKIYRLAEHLGVPNLSQEWILHLASGHVDRVVLRLPSEIARTAGVIGTEIVETLSRQGTLICSLDAAVEDATRRTERAISEAERARSSAEDAIGAFDAALASSSEKHDELVRRACAAAVEGTFAETSQSIAYQLEHARRSIGDVGRKIVARNEEQSAALEDAVASLMDSARQTLGKATKDALRSAVSDARKTSLSSDRAEKYRAAAAACAFVVLVLVAGIAGYSTGHAEGSKPAATQEARR